MTMTKVEKFNAIINAVADTKFTDGTSMRDFLNHEIEMTNKRNARKSTAPSKNQKANEEIKAKILDFLANHTDGMTATEIAKGLELSSPQKASALLRQLGDVALGGTGDVVKKKVGKSTVFVLA